MKLKDKIVELDKIRYANSNVDEMRRSIIKRKKVWIDKENIPKYFKFIINKIIRIKKDEEIFLDKEIKTESGNSKFIIEEYIENQIISIAFISNNDIHRISYRFTKFAKGKFIYTQTVKRFDRVFGTGAWLGKFLWKRDVRRKGKIISLQMKKLKKQAK